MQNAHMQKDTMPRDRAIALQYQEGENIPRILATGLGEIARQILRIAETHQIPIHKDEALTELLSHLPEGSQVPPQTYRVISEIICFLYALDRDMGVTASPQEAQLEGDDPPLSASALE